VLIKESPQTTKVDHLVLVRLSLKRVTNPEKPNEVASV
jgi:hypothetical protein